jgi:hypothetical protein
VSEGDPVVEDGYPIEQRPIIAYARSASGPTLTRFALDFARHGGGDLLWLAYIPEGLRGWFGRFADSYDPSRQPQCPFRIARHFGGAALPEIEYLVRRIESRSPPEDPEVSPLPAILSGETLEIAGEVERGGLHLTTVIFDVHHLGSFAQSLRCRGNGFGLGGRGVAPPELVADQNARWLGSLLARLRAAGLNVLFAAQRAPPTTVSGASVLGVVEAAADLTLDVAARSSSSSAPAQFHVGVRPNDLTPILPAAEFAAATWDDLVGLIRPPLPWCERLALACPRIERLGDREIRETGTPWIDANQEEFAQRAAQRGWTVSRATPEQDRGEHWDVAIERGPASAPERLRVDVKGRSRIRRSDPEPQDRWHWIELRGIVDDGWVFGGQADLIAFQTSDSFLLVRRLDLLAHLCHHVVPENLVSDPRQAEYRVYHRRDFASVPERPTGADRGVLTLVPVERLRRLAWEEWR